MESIMHWVGAVTLTRPLVVEIMARGMHMIDIHRPDHHQGGPSIHRAMMGLPRAVAAAVDIMIGRVLRTPNIIHGMRVIVTMNHRVGDRAPPGTW